MKKILSLLATAVLALTFVSCSSDDNETPTKASFIGNWKTYSVEYTLLKNGQVITEETSYVTDDDDYMIWSFRTDYTFVDVTSEDGDVETYQGTWFTSGDILYMNYKDVEMGYEWTDDYKISSCNSAVFVVQEKDTWTDGNVTYEEIEEITFKKQ